MSTPHKYLLIANSEIRTYQIRLNILTLILPIEILHLTMNGEKSKRQLSVNLLSENPPKRARTPIDKSERDVTSSNIDDGASPKAEIGSSEISTIDNKF